MNTRNIFAKLASWLLYLAGSMAMSAALLQEEQTAVRAAQPGDIVRLNTFLAGRTNLPFVPLEITAASGPQFLFSDKPEYLLSGDGITLREEVKRGDVRLYLYHVPTPGEVPKTISAVIENLGASKLKLTFLRRAFPQPGGDYHLIGKTGLMDFFNETSPTNRFEISVGGRAVLDEELDRTVVTRDQLVHGFYEFRVNQPARITVFQRGATQRSLDVIDELPLLPQILPEKTTGNGAGRGRFPKCNFDVRGAGDFAFDPGAGPRQLILADPKREDWIEGHDSIDDKPSRNVGNYGVIYRTRLAITGDGRHGVALLMCKIGGFNNICAAQAGAVKVSDGMAPGRVVAIPYAQTHFGKPDEGVLIQKFPPLSKGKRGYIELEYSPPGASCIPTPMVLVPFEP